MRCAAVRRHEVGRGRVDEQLDRDEVVRSRTITEAMWFIGRAWLNRTHTEEQKDTAHV